MSSAKESQVSLVSTPLLPYATVVVLLVVVRILRLYDRPARPEVTLSESANNNRMRRVRDACDILNKL